MQKATDMGVFYLCEEYACMLYEILLRAYFSQIVPRYWYEICDVLVPIFDILSRNGTKYLSVKFTQYEICTM